MMQSSVHILVNPNCHQGKGWKRWLSVREEILRMFPGANVIVSECEKDIDERLAPLLVDTKAIVISAGGDGSVHAMVNMMLKTPGIDRTRVTLGAIGLGSSNDFLKPFQALIGKIPVRINTGTPGLYHDVGIVKYRGGDGTWKEKYFIVNASFGATAEGNWNFNNPGRVLRWLKRAHTGAAITYAAIGTILSCKNKSVYLRYNGSERQAVVSNINVLKIPYVSGSLRYEQEILPDDGKLAVNVCFDLTRYELLQTLWRLEKGKFHTGEKKSSAFTGTFCFRSDGPAVFECDGETEMSTHVEIFVWPKAIRILSAHVTPI